MSIGARLTGLIGLLVVVLATVGALGLRGMSINVGSLRTVYEDRVVPLRQLKLVADAYAVNIVDTAHKVRAGKLTPRDGLTNACRRRSGWSRRSPR